jgi:hypothetical protein
MHGMAHINFKTLLMDSVPSVTEQWTCRIHWALLIIYTVKLSLYIPAQPIGVQEFVAPRLSIQFAREGGKVVSPRHQPLSPPSEGPQYSFLLEAESTPGP